MNKEKDTKKSEAKAEKTSGKQEARLKEAEKKVQEANKKAEEAESALAKEKDDYIRLMAEFENFRRRSAAERLNLINTASEKIILELLPVLDDCERALSALAKTGDNGPAKEGTELIFNKLSNILKAKGLKEIESTGQVFNTEMMEAIAPIAVEEEDKKGLVYDTVKKGYMLGDKVIRFAQVVVAQ